MYTRNGYLFIMHTIKLFLLLLCYYQVEEKNNKTIKLVFFTKENKENNYQ